MEQILEMKSQAEAIRVYTTQKQLGKDAELSAAEIVRRTERCIGLAIRKGQAEGKIRKPGEHEAGRKETRLSTRPHFSTADERKETYAMTDDVSDAQFEAAIGKARYWA